MHNMSHAALRPVHAHMYPPPRLPSPHTSHAHIHAHAHAHMLTCVDRAICIAHDYLSWHWPMLLCISLRITPVRTMLYFTAYHAIAYHAPVRTIQCGFNTHNTSHLPNEAWEQKWARGSRGRFEVEVARVVLLSRAPCLASCTVATARASSRRRTSCISQRRS